MAVDEGSLEAEVDAVAVDEDGLRIRLRLRNSADRALHYIAAVRSVDYDPQARRLAVRLTDAGRVVVPGVSNVRPPMRFVDPGAEAELTLRLPATLSWLVSDPDGDPRRVAFDRHRITDAEDVVVEIGWADVPFYEDPRPRDDAVLPSVRWEQHRRSAWHRPGTAT